jgi:hypothetical protein
MGKLNGTANDAMFLLGEVYAGVKQIRLDVAETKQELRTKIANLQSHVTTLQTDVATIKTNQRPKRRFRLPSHTTIRFSLAAGFSLAAAIIKIDPAWVGQVLAFLK